MGFRKSRENQSRLEQIAAEGVDYVVTSASDYQIFFSGAASVAMVNDESLHAAKQFYSGLFKNGTLIWSRNRGPVPYLQPGLEIYHVPRAVHETKLAPNVPNPQNEEPQTE